MTKNITSQSALFNGPNNKPVTMLFDQPASSSDAGAVLLGRIEARHGLIAVVSAALQDDRDQAKVRHSLGDIVAQRVYGIACGYEDGNDAKDLRHDPIQKLLLNRQPVSGAELASQPTLSRFENSITGREAIDMSAALLDWIVARHRKRLGSRKVRSITIDLDSTVDETHGLQQGSLFNGFYRSHCYLPMLGFLSFNNENGACQVVCVCSPGLMVRGGVRFVLGKRGSAGRVLLFPRHVFWFVLMVVSPVPKYSITSKNRAWITWLASPATVFLRACQMICVCRVRELGVLPCLRRIRKRFLLLMMTLLKRAVRSRLRQLNWQRPERLMVFSSRLMLGPSSCLVMAV